MLHCHVASVPAYTHFPTIFRYTADQNVSFMYMAFQCRDTVSYTHLTLPTKRIV